jgi:uncharacterized protein (TIGR01777 family)
MRVAVTGASGLIGTALVSDLRRKGHDVVRLVRRPARSPDEVSWDPEAGTVDLDGLAGVDAAVHLAGAGVGDRRWTAEYKRVLLESRVSGTRTLVGALTELERRPHTLVSASGIHFYGDRGEELLTESSGPGSGFLSDVVQAWEGEALRAADAGIRVVTTRSGLVMAPNGGAFSRLLTVTRLGAGGPMGNGRQWWSWITLDDEVAAFEFLLTTPEVSGPVNLTSPAPQRQADVARTIARGLRRPSLVPAPRFGLRLVLGEFADDVLASTRVVPQRLTDAGFTFRHADLDSAVGWLLDRNGEGGSA